MDIRQTALAAEAWVREHREELIRDLMALVNIPSVTAPGKDGFAFGPDCKRCGDAFLAMAAGYGFETDNDDDHCVSAAMPGTGAGELALLGHLDVVPAGNGWTFKPFEAVEKDGFVIGRGSGDNKAGVMISLYTLRALKALGVPFAHTLRVIGGLNEEAGMEDVKYYAATRRLPDFTLVCDGGFAGYIGEKGICEGDLVMPVTDGGLLGFAAGVASNAVADRAEAVLAGLTEEQEMVLRAAGMDVTRSDAGVTVLARGQAAHAATPEKGESAIRSLAGALAASGALSGASLAAMKGLYELFADDHGTGLGIAFEDEISGKTTAINGMAKMTDGVLCANFNIRYAITQDSADLQEKLRAAAAAKGFAVENMTDSPGRYSDPADPVIDMLIKNCQEFLGEEFTAHVVGGGTHARKLPNAFPYGPGGICRDNPYGGAHGPDEGVHIDSLIKAAAVYAAALMRLDQMV